jgi:hypothetical protein
MPLTAISIFSAMVERAARAPVTRLRPTSGRGVVVATLKRYRSVGRTTDHWACDIFCGGDPGQAASGPRQNARG